MIKDRLGYFGSWNVKGYTISLSLFTDRVAVGFIVEATRRHFCMSLFNLTVNIFW